MTGLSPRPLRPQALSACGTVESGTLGSDVASWRQAGGVNDPPPPRLAGASRTELGQVQASVSGRSCLRGDRSIGAVLSGRNWFVGDGVEHDFSLIGMDFSCPGGASCIVSTPRVSAKSFVPLVMGWTHLPSIGWPVLGSYLIQSR
jgi:hypothetical protein